MMINYYNSMFKIKDSLILTIILILKYFVKKKFFIMIIYHETILNHKRKI